MAWNDPTPEELAFQASHRQDYPQLLAQDTLTKKTSASALANKNARLLLKEHFPGVKFQVRLSKSSWSCDMFVEFPNYDEAPSHQQVQRVLYHFASQNYNSQSESRESRKEPDGRAFRQLFGSVTSVHSQYSPLAPADLAKARAQHLNATLPRSTRAPGTKGRL